jgi:hypothetical protein
VTDDEISTLYLAALARRDFAFPRPHDAWAAGLVGAAVEAARAAAQEEREACARTLEGMLPGSGRVSRPDRAWGEKAVAAIRARR